MCKVLLVPRKDRVDRTRRKRTYISPIVLRFKTAALVLPAGSNGHKVDTLLYVYQYRLGTSDKVDQTLVM